MRNSKQEIKLVLDNKLKGKFGEYLVASKLTKMGMSVQFVDEEYFDLTFYFKKHPSMRLFKVQVKTAELESRRPHLKNYSYKVHFGNYKNRQTNKLLPSHCDLMAYVAFDTEKVFFEPVKRVNVLHRRLGAESEFTIDAEKSFHCSMYDIDEEWINARRGIQDRA